MNSTLPKRIKNAESIIGSALYDHLRIICDEWALDLRKVLDDEEILVLCNFMNKNKDDNNLFLFHATGNECIDSILHSVRSCPKTEEISSLLIPLLRRIDMITTIDPLWFQT